MSPSSQSKVGLPPDDGVFVGRRDDLAALQARITAGQGLVTIVGAPGIGKTRLALEVIRAVRRGGASAGQTPANRDVEFCELADARDVDGICRAVATALGFSFAMNDAGDDLPLRLGQRLTARGPLLLVLDNFEQLVDHGPDTLAVWLRAAPQLQLLVTSREPLRLAGEQTHELGPLSLPKDGAEPGSSEAVQLFIARAQAARTSFAVTETDAPVIAKIARRLEGIPLAVELAAARTQIFSPQQLLERLEQSFDLLTNERRDAAPRHATLVAAIDWSWRLLSASEQQALRQAAIFRGGFGVEAAVAVLSAAGGKEGAELVASLCDRSLLRAQNAAGFPEEVRFTLLVSVREYVGSLAGDTPLIEAAKQRHASYYLRCGQDWVEQADGPAAATALRRLALESDNLIAIHESARCRQDSAAGDDVLAATLALDVLFSDRGTAERNLSLLDTALVAAGDADLKKPRNRVRVLYARGRAYRIAGRLDKASTDYRSGCQHAQALGDLSLEARGHLGLGLLALDTGELTQARRRIERALELARRAKDPVTEGRVMSSLGVVAVTQGELTEAEDWFERACSRLREVGARRWEGLACSNLGELRVQLDHPTAVATMQEALAIAEELEDRLLAGRLRFTLGTWSQDHGHFAEARESYRVALEPLRMVGAKRHEVAVIASVASVDHEQGRLPAARRGYEQALHVMRTLNDRRGVALISALLAGAQAGLGLGELAEKTLDDAVASLGEVGDPLFAAVIDLQRGQVDLAHAREAERASDVEAGRRFREAVLRRVAKAERPSQELRGRSRAQASADLRVALRILKADLRAGQPIHETALVLDGTKHELRHPLGVVSFARRPAARDLFYALAEHTGHAVTKAELVLRIVQAKYDAARHDSALRVNVMRLRKLLAPCGFEIEAMGGGYCLHTPNDFHYLPGDRTSGIDDDHS